MTADSDSLHLLPLKAQIDGMKADFQRVRAIFEHGQVNREYREAVWGRFSRRFNRLEHQLRKVEGEVAGDYHRAWQDFGELQLQSQRELESIQEALGGIAFGMASFTSQRASLAQETLRWYASQAGISWQPVVVFDAGTIENQPEEFAAESGPADNLIRIPLPRWDLWRFPLLLHDLGYLIAKNKESAGLENCLQALLEPVKAAFDEEPVQDELKGWVLPEIRNLVDITINDADVEAARRKNGPVFKRFMQRQEIHLWRLAADIFATYVYGPAYVYALVFLELDPTRAFQEGESAERNRYLPGPARRAAACLQTLKAMNQSSDQGRFSEGAFSADIQYLESIWEGALQAAGSLPDYQQVQASTHEIWERLYQELEAEFRFLGDRAISSWKKVVNEAAPALNGPPGADISELDLFVKALWRLRAQYTGHLEILTQNAEAVFKGATVFFELPRQNPSDEDESSSALRNSRMHDLEVDIERIIAAVRPETTSETGQPVIAGRLLRLASELTYELSKLRKFVELGAPKGSLVGQVIRLSESAVMQALRIEVLDYWGGTYLRKVGLDESICDWADSLMREYTGRAGFDWGSRVIPGKHPLFSSTSGLVHLRFPDWDIWNLPLMAHEFGHLVALSTPEFNQLLSNEQLTTVQGHPRENEWDSERRKAYVEQRRFHLHEFFADAAALYSQGPSFALAVILLNFNPAEAHLQRYNHPSHAERVEALFQILREMNATDKLNRFDPGPYEGVLKWLETVWAEAVGKAGKLEQNNIAAYHRLKARAIAKNIFDFLERYFSLGLRYPSNDWRRAVELARRQPGTSSLEETVHSESLIQLLNIAWACRITQIFEPREIARSLRPAFLERAGQSDRLAALE